MNRIQKSRHTTSKCWQELIFRSQLKRSRSLCDLNGICLSKSWTGANGLSKNGWFFSFSGIIKNKNP